jgi:hypothetical protein
LYLFLDASQGIARQVLVLSDIGKGIFDSGLRLSHIISYVTNVQYCRILSDPVTAVSPSISLKRISLSGLTLTHTMRFVLKRLAETESSFSQVMA